jgi:hypothetical protein
MTGECAAALANVDSGSPEAIAYNLAIDSSLKNMAINLSRPLQITNRVFGYAAFGYGMYEGPRGPVLSGAGVTNLMNSIPRIPGPVSSSVGMLVEEILK